MSNYTFTFKKDDITVEFTTTDKYIVERQFQLWVNSATEYTQQQKASTGEEKKNLKLEQNSNVQKSLEPVQVKPEAPAQVSTQKVEAQVEPQVVVEKSEPVVEPAVESVIEQEIAVPVEAPTASVIESQTEPQSEQYAEVPQAEMVDSAPDEASEVFDKASSLLKTINTIQNPESETAEPKETFDFEKVLEKTIENPTFEPSKAKDETFLSILASKNTQDKFHYLIITAYYLLEYEKMDRFSLKQINAKLMQNLSEIVDHSVLQAAIEQNFIDIVPDLTGVSDIAEYKLTDLGEDFFVNKI